MKQVLALAVMALVVGSGFGQGTEATIRAKCGAEWPGDFEMQAYCERNQQEAVVELRQLTATRGGLPEDAFKTVLSGCVREWPGDFEMQAYCLRNQIDGYQEVSRGPASPLVSLTAEESATIAAHCASEWPGDFEMQSYCERQQSDGVAYLRTISDEPALQACNQEWPGDFEMQAYCVREGLY